MTGNVVTGRANAAFTIVQNEPAWLPVWFDYYAAQLGPQNVFVLDHDSTEIGLPALARVRAGGGRVVPVHRSVSFDHGWLRDTVERFQAFLLQSYRTVLFAEADEFLLTPHPDGLAGLMDNMSGLNVRAQGFNVVHYRDEEPPLRFDQRPLLAQRRWWVPSRLYSKTVVARVPLHFTPGFHDIQGGGDEPDPLLFMAHLHRADFAYALAKHRESAARNWNAHDRLIGAGLQNRITDEGQLLAWFYKDDDVAAPRQEIPAELKTLV